MKENNIAKVYAETLTQLGKENNFDVAKELTTLTETINTSNDLENVLFLDVFSNEEKTDVFKAIADKINLSNMLKNAVIYLINEKRISLLPLIYKEVIVADDFEKGFIRGTIEGKDDSISEGDKEKLMAALKSELSGKKPVLDYTKNKNITAGYRVTVGDYQVDATVDNQLKNFRQSVLGL
ncbi:MAG: hypothetical protein CME62_17130 [Halobacteriovoraceae bacterium]|nr:hypothetical protein [Halobacteriovoraceae bacterium]|tara:strand:+ start:5760 stop:6302 length:543 start_codon:yes stop_codon:yes gene_type:complete